MDKMNYLELSGNMKVEKPEICLLLLNYQEGLFGPIIYLLILFIFIHASIYLIQN